MFKRLQKVHLKLERPLANSLYAMLSHKRSPLNRERYKLLRDNSRDFTKDGLNNVVFKLGSIRHYPMITHFLIDVGTKN